jgi:hypothetical protein
MPWQPDGTPMALADESFARKSAVGLTCSVPPSRRMLGMSDDEDPFYSPTLKPSPPRVALPVERLFEFLRASDRPPMSCELRSHGESYG